MIFDLLDKLIDRLLELAREKERVDRSVFEQVVQPAFRDFEAVHEEYLTSFQSYQEALDKSPAVGPGHSVFSNIVSDSLRRRTLINKLRVFQASDAQSSDLNNLNAAIGKYLSFSTDFLCVESLIASSSLEVSEKSDADEFPLRFSSWLSIQREGHRQRELSNAQEYERRVCDNDPGRMVAEVVRQAAASSEREVTSGIKRQ